MPSPTPFVRALPAATLLSCAAAFYLYWGTSSLLGDFAGDNAVYWLTASFLSPWGVAHPAAAHFAQASIFPPLYPAVLAALGGGTSLFAAHLVSALLAVLGLFSIAAAARMVGLSALLAAVVVVLCAATRVGLLEAIELHSEHLYLPLSFAAIALAATSSRPRALWPAAACVAAAALTRSFGLALLLAFLLWLATTRPRQWPLLGVLAAGPALLWSLYDDGSSRYFGDLAALYRSHGVARQLATNISFLWSSWQACFAEAGLAGFVPALPAVLAVVAAAGTVRRLRAGACDGWYVPGALALIAIWPYPGEYERLLYPLLPLLVIHALHAVDATQRGTPALRRLAVGLVLAVLLAAELPFLALFAARFAAPPSVAELAPYVRSRAWYYQDFASARRTVGYQYGVINALTDIKARALVPAADCMLASKPSIVALYAGQVVHVLPPFAASAAQLEEHIRRGPCSYLLMLTAPTPSFPEAYFPYRRLGARLTILADYPNPALPGQPAALLGRLTSAELPAELAQ